MVDMEEMLGVVMDILEKMVTEEEATTVPIKIATVIAVMVTVNLWTLGNIFILLMKMQSLKFLVQPVSSSKSGSALLRARLSFIIAPTLTLNIVLVLPNHTLLSSNILKFSLWKATLLHLQFLPSITKGRKQVMKNLMIFNGRVFNALWLLIQMITLILEELFPFALPLNMHQYIKQ